jgi:hypothetical protein
MTVQNDSTVLDQRVQVQSTTVPLSRPGMASQSLTELGTPSSTSFLYVANVLPPMSNGAALPATHIVTHGRFAYVSYAGVGQARVGAVDVFDCRNPARPKLVSSALFSDTKVYSLALDSRGTTLYLGTSSSDPSFPSPAVVEAVALKSGKLTDRTIRASVSSWAVTGLSVQGRTLWVTSGTGPGMAQGGVTLLNASTLAGAQVDGFDDARGVATSSALTLVAQGQPGTLRVYNTNGTLRETVAAGGLDVPDSKATVSLSYNWGFMSLGRGGVAVFRTSKPAAVVTTLPAAPVPPGADPADVVTNAVAPLDVNHRNALVFTADGGGGIRVWYSDYPSVSQSRTPAFVYLGAILPSTSLPGSSNMVGATYNTLLAANGLGGLRLFRFSVQ